MKTLYANFADMGLLVLHEDSLALQDSLALPAIEN